MIPKPHENGSAAPRCCLHIGLPKTATKTLQMGLLARHSEVDYLGTYTGKRRHYQRQCRDGQVAQLMGELIWDHYRAPDFALAHRLFSQIVQPSLDQGRVPVFSWESLMENRAQVIRQRAENLREVFGECRVIATIRHPLKLVESLYLQLLKRDNVGGYARVGLPMRYQPFDRWVIANWKKKGGAPKVHLEYAHSLEIYADVFGNENVGVFVFEQLIEDAQGYYSAICRFVGIDPEEGFAHVDGRRENQRWTETQLRRLQEIQSSSIKSLVFRFSARPVRRKMLGLPSNSRGIPQEGSRGAKLSLPESLQQRVLDKTRAGNRCLMETWKLPLEQYQYPV